LPTTIHLLAPLKLRRRNLFLNFSDFFPTVCELGGAELPKGVKFDGQSFAPQIEGKKGSPRKWVYVELNGKSYARDAKYKLAANGDLFDLSDAPFKEIPVASDSSDKDAAAAREELQSVLADHKALPGKPMAKAQQRQKRQQQRKRLQRQQAAEKAT